MKKYTIKSILILAIGCMLHSCLDLDPKDQIADGNYWQTATDFKLFSNQFYGWTRDFKNSVYDAPHSDKRSDLIMDKGSKNVFANGTNSIPASDGNYTDAYNRIRRTNILLQKSREFCIIKTDVGVNNIRYQTQSFARFFRLGLLLYALLP